MHLVASLETEILARNTAVLRVSCHCLPLLSLHLYRTLRHLSILIANMLPRDGIKLSALISTAFHHLECRCLINRLEDQTKQRGERKAPHFRLKRLSLWKIPRVFLPFFLHIFLYTGLLQTEPFSNDSRILLEYCRILIMKHSGE